MAAGHLSALRPCSLPLASALLAPVAPAAVLAYPLATALLDALLALVASAAVLAYPLAPALLAMVALASVLA
jgi:hypothetical protein